MSGIFGASLGMTREGAAPPPPPPPPVGTPADFVTETVPLVAAMKVARDLVSRGIVSFEQSLSAPLPWQRAAYGAYLLQIAGRALQGMGAAIQGAAARRAGATHPDLQAGQRAAATLIGSLQTKSNALRMFL